MRGEITQARLSLKRSYLHQDKKVESSITDESFLGRENSMYQSLQQEHGRFKEVTESQQDSSGEIKGKTGNRRSWWQGRGQIKKDHVTILVFVSEVS